MSEEVQRFRTTSGRLTGIMGLVMCTGVGALFVVTEHPAVAVPGVLGCAFAALLVWCSLLRPRVSATSASLDMLTLLQRVEIPLASIDTVLVRRYLVVRAGGVRYICPAIGRSLRKTVRSEMKWQGNTQMLSPGLQAGDKLVAQPEVKDPQELDYADFVESEIMRLADQDRVRRGIEARSEEEYELGAHAVRRWARLEIGALVVLAIAFVVSLVVV